MSIDVSSAPVGGALSGRKGDRRVTVIRAPAFSFAGMLQQLTKLVEYRDLLYTLTVHRIKVRYKQSVLGLSWAILQPLSLMLIYTLIFSVVARMPSDDIPYPLFAYTGLLPWTYFSTALSTATNGLVSHSHLVTKVYFPREILPVTYVLAALFDFLIASLVLAGLMIYYRAPITLNFLYVVPIILVLTIFALAMSLFMSAVQVRFRDVGVAMPLLLQVWMFATPIIYPLSAVPERLRPIYDLNPTVGVIEGFRNVLLQGTPPNFRALGASALVSLILLPLMYIYFKHVEATVADVV
ncbi:MAG: ABC transporter permease [Pyrinomonadaceae bacterium]|nr:ABC transporter permease [Pyrinomonadaceae bacterium]